ncbi:hypothetical protein L1887_57202 [Cichorium endivia]|nr:hypothetical protein L1887_57202 [Cichorium endivia]
MSSNYPAPPSYAPKGYQAVPQHDAPSYGAAADAGAGAAPRDVDQEGDPDDFKFGVTVEQSSPEIRAMFLRKQNQWAFHRAHDRKPGDHGIPVLETPLAPDQHPAAFALHRARVDLARYRDHLCGPKIVLQAMVITAFTFFGLTLFTLQSKWDFSSPRRMAVWWPHGAGGRPASSASLCRTTRRLTSSWPVQAA